MPPQPIMPDSVESTDQNFETLDRTIGATGMAETYQTETSNAPEKRPNVVFSIWPPSDRTRESVRNRLIETLSAPSILSKRYGTISREEAVDVSKVIEEDAFKVAGEAATSDGDGIEILQVYSKEISKRMLEKVKARSGESEAASSTTTQVNESAIKAEEDAGSTAPPPSGKAESVAGDE